MRIDREGDALLIILESCCAIMYVEEHTALLQRTLADIAANNQKVTKITVDISDVEEMDTAYLQLMLIFKQEIQRRGIPYVVLGFSPCVSELLECFGISPKDK